MNEVETRKDCHCGSAECWPANDYSWLASRSGWHGNINGCASSVFFIHGMKIREQRHIPTGHFDLNELPGLLAKWGEGLPSAFLYYTHDTGGGDWGLWIEGVREPNADDWKRLEETRARDRQEAERTLKSLRNRYPDLA